MISKSSLQALGMAAVAAGLLAACGGDDGYIELPPDSVAATSVPDSALASSTAYTSFALSLSKTSSETDEPLTASNVNVPPSSETDEPATVS